MVQFLNIVALLGAVAGGFTLFATVGAAKGAPQEAAGAAMAVALAIIPYVFARAVQIVVDRREQNEHRSRVLDRLDSLERAFDRRARAEVER